MSAWISGCGSYRYNLKRLISGGEGRALAWLMLNPSTADATQDDPTIRKVMGFSRRNRAGLAVVVNLFAWRATDPKDCLANLADAEGPYNYKAVTEAAAECDAVICAWGAQKWAREQAESVLTWLEGRSLLCLGTTKDGSPRHPLMVPYAQALVPFTGLRSAKATDRSSG